MMQPFKHSQRRLMCLLLVLFLMLPGIPRARAAQTAEPIHLLLVGQDRQEGQTARSDSMILCSIHPETKQMVLTSFLRDLYVPIPGWGSNRINAAYAFGGISLLEKTLEENFQIPIQGSIQVDFSQFAQIIDLLGGVELELRQDEADHIAKETGSVLSAGRQHLDGAQALSYSRIRRLDKDGDFSRTQRQRQVLNQLLENYRDANFVTVAKLVGKVIPMITTDLSARELLNYAITLFPILSQMTITAQRIPADGTYRDETIDNMQVLVADMEKARQLLQETVNPKT